MHDSDCVTAPWSNMPHHRVAVAEPESMVKKTLKLLHLHKTDSGNGLWGTASAREQALAMLGGTTGPQDLSSVLAGVARSSGKAQTGSTAR
jgi:hypothetical protein